MKVKLIHYFIITLLAIFMSACNNDIFIEKLILSTDYALLGPDCKSTRIDVSGKNWSVENVSFFGDGGFVSCSPTSEGLYHIETPYADLYMRTGRGNITVELVSYLGVNNGVLSFSVCDEYFSEDVVIDILPTDKFDTETEDVSYTLDTWGGYPDEDYTKTLINYSYPEGFSAPVSFVFPDVESLTLVYYFEPLSDDDVFAQKVLNSGIEVPIPSYTFYSSPIHEYWSMTGEKAKLTTSRNTIRTTFVPPMPAAVDLPAGTPLAVQLQCDYESVALSCKIKAVNPISGAEETIECRLRMHVPVKLNTEVIIK